MEWGWGWGPQMQGKVSVETFLYLAKRIKNFKNISLWLAIPLLVIELEKVINKMHRLFIIVKT